MCKVFISELENKYVNSVQFEDNNFFFHPKWPEFLTTHYMPICPLWTGNVMARVLPSCQKGNRCSNSIVENWMRIVKKIILANEVKLRPTDLIRKLREGIYARQKAFEFAFLPISSKLFKRKGYTCSKDNSLIEEVWKRRKSTKRSYFSPYKIPKKSEVDDNKRKTMKRSKKQNGGNNIQAKQNTLEKSSYKTITSSSDKKIFKNSLFAS